MNGIYNYNASHTCSHKVLAIFVLMDVIFDETLGKVHNEERKFQFSGDVFKVEVDEFTMQSQEKGKDFMSGDFLSLYSRFYEVIILESTCAIGEGKMQVYF